MADIPQCSCLYPLLFVAYINDMPTLPRTYLNLFTDDTLIHNTSISSKRTVNKLQKQLEQLLPWFDDWKLYLNINKTVTVLFGNHIKKSHPIVIRGIPRNWSKSTKYLGFTLDSHLKFNRYPHIKNHPENKIHQCCTLPFYQQTESNPSMSKTKYIQNGHKNCIILRKPRMGCSNLEY